MARFQKPSDKDRINLKDVWDPDEYIDLKPQRGNEVLVASMLKGVELPKGAKIESLMNDMNMAMKYVNPVVAERHLLYLMVKKAVFYYPEPDYAARQAKRDELRAENTPTAEIERFIEEEFGDRVPWTLESVEDMLDVDRSFLRDEVESRDGSLRKAAEEGVVQPAPLKPGAGPRFQPGVSSRDDIQGTEAPYSIGGGTVAGETGAHARKDKHGAKGVLVGT